MQSGGRTDTETPVAAGAGYAWAAYVWAGYAWAGYARAARLWKSSLAKKSSMQSIEVDFEGK